LILIPFSKTKGYEKLLLRGACKLEDCKHLRVPNKKKALKMEGF